jgi:type I restriction enzyme R subunit
MSRANIDWLLAQASWAVCNHKRDRATRAVRWERLDEDLEYKAKQLDREVVAPEQIRSVVRIYRDKFFTENFPGRTEAPKTLTFTKDDGYAADIVKIVREESGKGNDLAQKITSRTTGKKPEDIIPEFRNTYFPRIASPPTLRPTTTTSSSMPSVIASGTRRTPAR